MEVNRGIHGLIVAVNYNKALEKAYELIRSYELIGITLDDHLKFENYSTVIFENGDHWTVLGSDTCCRKGMTINIAYIDKELDKEIIDSIIFPQLKAYPYQAYRYF